MSKRQLIFLFLTLAWMLVIFLYSSKNATESTEDSLFVGYTVGKIFVPGFNNWDSDKQLAFAQAVDHPVRKTAHATEFAILAFFSFMTLYDRRRKTWISLLSAFVFSVIYACTDEFHQTFVEGRSGQLTDVGIDSIGAFAAMLLCFLVVELFIKRKYNEKGVKNIKE